MTTPSFLAYDTADDRREIYNLLGRLSPPQRVAWLRWCCTQCVLPNSDKQPIVPPNHSGLAMECFFDFWSLVHVYRLDAALALAELVRRVRARR